MTRKFLVGVVLALVAVTALAWNAGEMHRENCIREGHRACSVLPWENGKAKPRPVAKPSNPFDSPTLDELLGP